MPENPQEQTEAKLLAYIDGELDDAGRADIERHIEANPKHRKLLDELSAGRRLLRLLPREVAPVDLYDNIQSQFERQELLESVATLGSEGRSSGSSFGGDDGAINPETGNFRLNRWGKLRAAAAIALLASGVGLVVYNVASPGGNSNIANNEKPDTRVIAAVGAESKQATTDDASSIVAATDAMRRERMADAADQARKLLESQDSPTENTRRDSGNRSRAIEKAAAAGGSDRTPSDLDQFADPTAGHESVFLVVSGGDPAAVRADVLSLLSEKGLTYSRVPVNAGQTDFKRQVSGLQQAEGAAIADAAPKPRPAVADKSEMRRAGTSPGPAAAKAVDADSGIASKGDRSAAELEEVVIVRRVPRSRAAELVAAMHQPTSARYAQSFRSPSLDGLTRREVAFGGAAKQLMRGAADSPAKPNAPVAVAPPAPAAAGAKKSAGDAPPAIMSPTPALADGGVEGGPDASQRKGSSPAGPQQPAAAAAPSTRELAKTSPRPVAPPKPGGQPMSANGQGGAGGAPADPAQATGSPARGTPQGLPPSPARPMTSSPTRPATANEPNGQVRPFQAATLRADDSVLSAGDAIELIYLDLRRGGQPVAQPMRVSTKGTIFVAGVGEFSLAGLTPTDAAAKLTAAMRGKNPEAKGVEIRRSTAEAEVALGGGKNGGNERAVPANKPTTDGKLTPEEMSQRPVPPSIEPSPVAPGAPAPVAPPAPIAPAALTDEDYVDLVIVVQKDVAAEKTPDER